MKNIIFEEFLIQKTSNTVKNYSNFMGITKKDHPKWSGWSLISKMSKSEMENICLKDKNPVCILVRNFYFIQYLEKL